MELKVIRNKFTEHSTMGDLLVNGVFECHTLEDKERGLNQQMSLADIQAKKVFGLTAIPYGKYEVAITFSAHFQKLLPLIMGVKGFDGVRIHSGNRPEDTEGCLLLGTTEGVDFVSNSRDAFKSFMEKLQTAANGEKIFIEYTGPNPTA